MTTPTLLDRYEGALLALACGDAIGTTVEFSPRGAFAPVRHMVGGGPFSLPAGFWTDDTSMALCLAESLIARDGFDARDQMARYLNWWHWGYWSSTGTCFDIGGTTQDALVRFEATGEPFAGATAPDQAGNGSLMRLAPVVLRYFPSRPAVREHAAASSLTTHGAPEAVDCCRLLANVMCNALDGLPKTLLLSEAATGLTQAKVLAIAGGAFLTKPEAAIRGSGYAVDAIEAALWCVMTTDTLEAAILRAANLGDDADTTAAITGQIAGALHGARAIPNEWLETLHLCDTIRAMAGELHRAASAETFAAG